MKIYDIERERLSRGQMDAERLARFWSEQAYRASLVGHATQQRIYKARSEWYWQQEQLQYAAQYFSR